MEKTEKQINSELEKVVNDISVTDRQAFVLNARYAKGDFDHDVLIKSLAGMQKYREKLFAELIKLEKNYEDLGYEVKIHLEDAKIVLEEG